MSENVREIVLIDLSSVLHPIWHVTQSDPDVNRCSQQTVARIRALASGQPHVAICCDAGPSFRKEIDPNYKANRPATDASLYHQMDLAIETLRADGFPVWKVRGFEADDLIASACARAVDCETLIVSADKDLLQLVDARTSAKSLTTGVTLDSMGVVEKFGVNPSQIRDYLSLVGDTSDNVTGAKGIGAKRAVELLTKFGDLDTLYDKLAESDGKTLGLTPAVTASLVEFATRFETVRKLITLRTDVDLPFEEIFAERRPKGGDLEEPMPDEIPPDTFPRDMFTTIDVKTMPAPPPEPAREVVTPQADGKATVTQEVAAPTPEAKPEPAPKQSLLDSVVSATPLDWERQLEPRSIEGASWLAKQMFDSRMFSGYGTPAAVLSTILVGRELGLPAMASLRGIYSVEGRHAIGASTMVALILASGLAEYFEPISFDEKQATFETKRKGARNAVRLTHTIEMATTAGLVKPKSNWEKTPTDMLCARAQARLARLVYPDRMMGLYTPEELAETAK